MSELLLLNENSLDSQLPAIFERYDKHIAEAEPIFDIAGSRLEVIARDLPHHQAKYGLFLQEAKSLVKWLENHKARIEGRLTKNYLQGQRVYGARETNTLIASEKEIVEINQLIIEASIIANKLDEIVESIKQLGWMVGNIVKLRVASIQDAII